jgi:uncharacterized protein (TIGR03435 family)
MVAQAYPISVSLRLAVGIEKVVSGGPEWIDGSYFDIEAKAEDPMATLDQLRRMLQTLLKDRFQLLLHAETREFSGYHMVPAKDGFKLNVSNGPLTAAEYSAAIRNSGLRPFFANNMTLSEYAELIGMQLKMPIVDKTGISGKFNIFLDSAETGGGEFAPSIFTAFQEQLGLKLEVEKISFEILLIDHAEKPSEN